MSIQQFKSTLQVQDRIGTSPDWNCWNSRSSRKLTSLRLQLMRRCRIRPQQVWYNVLGLYGSPLVCRVSNTKRHSHHCISERVSDPNSALNGFSPGKSLLFRLLAHCSHTLTVQSVCILVFWGIPLAIALATALSDFGEPYTRAADVP